MGKHRSVGRRKSILLTNYFCYVSVFQPLQCPSVERTFYNRLYVYGRGRRRCGDPTIQADRFPLVGNAHRAFRGKKHGRMPFGRSTGKHKIDGTNTQCKFQPMHRPSVERTFRNLLYVYGCGRRSSSRTAYRLRLRSSPRMLTPSFLLSEKSHAASLLLACKRARDAPTCYQLFSVSGGVVMCLFSCCSAGGKHGRMTFVITFVMRIITAPVF